MTLLLKDPEAALDYAVDWGAEYLDVDTVAQSDWTVEPDEELGVTVAGSAFDAAIASVTATGGIAGHIYRLTNHVVLSSGLSDSRSIVLRVEKR
jgi:hypothetical protein